MTFNPRTRKKNVTYDLGINLCDQRDRRLRRRVDNQLIKQRGNLSTLHAGKRQLDDIDNR